MDYELKLKNWSGPLHKLLELIEERKMDVTEVSLAAVTDDFLKYLEAMRAEFQSGVRPPEEDMRILADFIVVASRLILIKSKSLLPDLALTEEEERDIKDLESRLLIYQRLKGALKHVQTAWKSDAFSASRPYFMNSGLVHAAVFYPGKNVSREEIFAAAARVFDSLQKFVLETRTIEETIISLEEKMQDIVKRMETATESTLASIAGGSKGDLVVAFLAALHLAREQLIFLEQQAAFSDIIVKRK